MGSAVCAFNMSAINSSFNGPFKYQSDSNAAWRPITDYKKNFQCEDGPEGPGSKESVMAADKYQIMDESVNPVSPNPLLTVDYHK